MVVRSGSLVRPAVGHRRSVTFIAAIDEVPPDEAGRRTASSAA